MASLGGYMFFFQRPCFQVRLAYPSVYFRVPCPHEFRFSKCLARKRLAKIKIQYMLPPQPPLSPFGLPIVLRWIFHAKKCPQQMQVGQKNAGEQMLQIKNVGMHI